jgi:hypothetical protein
MSDQPLSKPRTWQEWRLQHGLWAWVLSPEWLSEWIVYWSRSWDFVEVLQLIGKLGLLYAAFSWVFEADERYKARQDAIKAKHYRAWELINSARGSTGDGGRRDALRDLFEDGVSLAGAPLSKAYLVEINLPGANLPRADLSKTNLLKANLSGAYLSEANLSKAILGQANLSKANPSSIRPIRGHTNVCQTVRGQPIRGQPI